MLPLLSFLLGALFMGKLVEMYLLLQLLKVYVKYWVEQDE